MLAACDWLVTKVQINKALRIPPHPRLSHRVHEDHRYLLLPHPLLPPAGLRHPAAQSGLHLWGDAVFWPLWCPPVAEVRLSKDSRGEAACCFFPRTSRQKFSRVVEKVQRFVAKKRWREVAEYTNTKFSNKVATQVTVRVNFTSKFNLRDPPVRLKHLTLFYFISE